MVNKYSDLSERDKQVTLLERMDAAKTAIENMSAGGPMEYIVDENGKVFKGNVTFKLPSNIKDLDSYVFYYALRYSTGLTSADLSSLTAISGGNGARYMFNDCRNLTSVDLSSLTTISGSYGAGNMFSDCTSLTSADLSSLATISGSNGASYMFNGCSKLTSVDLSSLTTISGDYGASNMFNSCSKLTSVDLSSLTTISGTFGTNHMFRGCTKLTSVDLSSLATISGSSGVSYMFNGCTSLKELRFPALTADGLGSDTSQFSYMLNSVSRCTVHFPASTQAKIEAMSGYPNFGGTNTVVLFDL